MALLIVPIVWIAIAGGRRMNGWIMRGDPPGMDPLSRSLFGLATGFGALAYGMLAIGLLRMLYPAPAFALVALLALAGWSEHGRLAREIMHGARGLRPTFAGALTLLLFAGFVAASLIGCFTPPAGLEWDSLSYHLSDPKIYLQHHRILYLPWESHSNFAFTTEMLFTLGLIAHSVPLAKLFHFTLAAVAALATYQIGARLVSSRVGALAVLLFVSLPLVFWEAGTAYVDLAATAFGTLALLALANAIEDQEASPKWLVLSAVMMGWMVSVKATSIIPLGLFALFIGGWQWRKRGVASGVRSAVLWGLLALAVGSVWYVKSWAYTGNPFYPFAYSIFGGRYWNAANAAVYAAAQRDFGVGHGLAFLLMAPWNLTMYLMPGHFLPAGAKGFNDAQTPIMALSPMFLAAVFAPAFAPVGVRKAVNWLAAYALVSVIVWFFLTQQVRYLLPIVPVLCLLTGVVLDSLWRQRAKAGYALAALFAVCVLFSLYIGGMLIRIEAPAALDWVPARSYLAMDPSLGAPYEAIVYVNTHTQPGDKVVFYGEPRGYYCNRPYLWGEPGHSLLIPYGRLQTPAALRAYLTERGYRYILLNYQGAPVAPGPGWAGMVYGLTLGSDKAPVFEDQEVYVFEI